MKQVMSYIFLERNEKEYKKNKDGNYVLTIDYNVYDKLNKLYKISRKQKNEIDSFYKKKQCGSFVIQLNKIKRTIEFELCSAQGTYYLDIISNERSIKDNVALLERVNNDIIGSNNVFDDKYITIISYDSISQYYCDKIYSKLNLFERKFRKLLLITYTARFKKAYFETTVPIEIIKSAKRVIKSENNEERLKNYLYSLEYGKLRSLLFDKSWNEYDEKEISKFLEDNDDLHKLSDEELRKK